MQMRDLLCKHVQNQHTFQQLFLVNILALALKNDQHLLNFVLTQVIHVEKEKMVEGRVPGWKPNGRKVQWLTRIEYLSRSPYEVTPER